MGVPVRSASFDKPLRAFRKTTCAGKRAESTQRHFADKRVLGGTFADSRWRVGSLWRRLLAGSVVNCNSCKETFIQNTINPIRGQEDCEQRRARSNSNVDLGEKWRWHEHTHTNIHEPIQMHGGRRVSRAVEQHEGKRNRVGVDEEEKNRDKGGDRVHTGKKRSAKTVFCGERGVAMYPLAMYVTSRAKEQRRERKNERTKGRDSEREQEKVSRQKSAKEWNQEQEREQDSRKRDGEKTVEHKRERVQGERESVSAV
eukprot:6186267-Pleurochrysis_carterae.AAC.1